jgi:hypothetical protein
MLSNDRRSSARRRRGMARANAAIPRIATRVAGPRDAQDVPTQRAIVQKLMADSRIAFGLAGIACPGAGARCAPDAPSASSARGEGRPGNGRES